MSMLDQIDPNLRDVVERLRGDPTSLLYRGGQGGFPTDFGADRLRPMSKDASARKAEIHLVEVFSEGLAGWLRSAFLNEWDRLAPLGGAARIERTSGRGGLSPRGEVIEKGRKLSGWLAQMGSGLPPLEQGRSIDLIASLGGGIATLDDLMFACVLGHRLAPAPQTSMFAALIERARGRPTTALKLLLPVYGSRLADRLVAPHHAAVGGTYWELGLGHEAAASFVSACSADTGSNSFSSTANLFVAGLLDLPGPSIREVLARVGTDGASAWWDGVSASLITGRRRVPGGLSARAVQAAMIQGPEPLRTRISHVR